MKIWKRILLLILVGAILPLMAWSQHERAAIEKNQTKLERWQEQPNLFARLEKNAIFFALLPEKRQRELQSLHQKLSSLPEYKRAELLNTAERYAKWLSRLKSDDRERVEYATTNKERLRVIRKIRDEQWLQRQPRAIRDEVNNAPGAKQGELIQHYRDEERKRRELWQLARGFWKDLHFKRQPMIANRADLPRDVQFHVEELLVPLLSNSEKKQLQQAEQQGWPWYPKVLVQLASKYPPALLHEKGPVEPKQLPMDVRKRFRLKSGKTPKSLIAATGEYPRFIIAVTEFAKKRDVVFPNEYWPYNAKGLSPRVRDFVENKLLPLLSPHDTQRLSFAEGKWPAYPNMLQSLAQKHNLLIPWQPLPGSPETWERYQIPRKKLVRGFRVVPRHKLREFARFDLTAKERASLQLFRAGAWERLSRAYFQHKQQALQKLQDDMEDE